RGHEVSESTRSMTPEEATRWHDTGEEPEGLEYQSMGYAIIPAAILNQHGKPHLYDHDYLGDGSDRRELVHAAESWEAAAKEQSDESDAERIRGHAKEIRDAVTFLDQVGWQTALRLREPAPEDYARPAPWFRVESVDDGDA